MKTKKRLVIIGAGDFGREVLDWALDIPANARDWDKVCFLDSNPSAFDSYPSPKPIIGDPETYDPSENDLFLCAIGAPRAKLRLCRDIVKRGGVFTTLIHPTAVVGSNNIIGEGTILCPGAEIIEAEPHALTGNESIDGLERWDSLAVVSFIAMADEKFRIALSPQKISDAKTVQDLILLLGDNITQ